MQTLGHNMIHARVNHNQDNTVFAQLCPQLHSHSQWIVKFNKRKRRMMNNYLRWNQCNVIDVTRQENLGIQKKAAVNLDVCTWNGSWAPLKYLEFLFYSLWHTKLTVGQCEAVGFPHSLHQSDPRRRLFSHFSMLNRRWPRRWDEPFWSAVHLSKSLHKIRSRSDDSKQATNLRGNRHGCVCSPVSSSVFPY